MLVITHAERMSVHISYYTRRTDVYTHVYTHVHNAHVQLGYLGEADGLKVADEQLGLDAAGDSVGPLVARRPHLLS